MVLVPGAHGFVRHIRCCHPELGDVRLSNIMDHCTRNSIGANDAQNIIKGLAPRTKIQIKTHSLDSPVETWVNEEMEPTDTTVAHALKPAERFEHLNDTYSSIVFGDIG